MSRPTADIVLEAIQDMHNLEQVVTRETLSEYTNLKLSMIDDRVTHLIDHGHVYRIQRGVFIPAPMHKPARIITRSLCPDGVTVLEVGDIVIHLTPREARMVGELMAGAGQQYTSIALGQQAERIAGELSRQVLRLGKRKERVARPKKAETTEINEEIDLKEISE